MCRRLPTERLREVLPAVLRTAAVRKSCDVGGGKAIMAGENERTTTTVRDLTGHEPRTLEEYLHDNRDAFL